VPHPSSAQHGSAHSSINNQTGPAKETLAPLILGKIDEIPEPPVDDECLMTALSLDGPCANELPVITQDSPDCNGPSNEQPISRQTENRPNISMLSAATSGKENPAPNLIPPTSSIFSNPGHEYGQFRRTSRPRKTVNS